MLENTREILNLLYSPIINKSDELYKTLKKQDIACKITRGFFSGHYHKNSEGEYRPDMYPIPAISLSKYTMLRSIYKSIENLVNFLIILQKNNFYY